MQKKKKKKFKKKVLWRVYIKCMQKKNKVLENKWQKVKCWKIKQDQTLKSLYIIKSNI